MDPESFYGVKHIEWDDKLVGESANYDDFSKRVEPGLKKLGVSVYRCVLPYNEKQGWYPANFPYSYTEHAHGKMSEPHLFVILKVRDGLRDEGPIYISHSTAGYEDAIRAVLPDYIRWDGTEGAAMEADF